MDKLMGLVLPWKQAFRPVWDFPHMANWGKTLPGGLEHFMRWGPRLNKKITSTAPVNLFCLTIDSTWWTVLCLATMAALSWWELYFQTMSQNNPFLTYFVRYFVIMTGETTNIDNLCQDWGHCCVNFDYVVLRPVELVCGVCMCACRGV